jgi:hypothetical protein
MIFHSLSRNNHCKGLGIWPGEECLPNVCKVLGLIPGPGAKQKIRNSHSYILV